MNNNIREIYNLFDELCKNLAGKNHKESFKHVTQFISDSPLTILNSTLPYDESSIISKLTMFLSSKTENNVLLLTNLHEQLTTYTELRNRNSILIFLIYIAEFELKKKSCTSMQIESSNNLLISNQNLTAFSNTGELYPIKNVLQGNSRLKFLVKPELKKLDEKYNSYASREKNKNDIELKTIETPDLMEELVQDAIYSFTGIQGKYLRKDIISGGFRLDPNARKLNTCYAGMLLRLSELGYYHNQIQIFTDKKSGRGPLGLLGQGLISCLLKELTHYYGMVAMLQEQLNKNKQNMARGKQQEEKLTLLRVMLWAAEPIHRLKWFTTITEACQDKKGGALASAVYDFKKNGDPTVKAIVKELLVAICSPLQCMLSKWILDGEIEDPFSEFFIETLPEVCSERLWHDKYRVREGLLPNFISKQLAHKILVTGKSINYLREVCLDKTSIRGRDDLKNCFVSNVDNLFSSVSDTKLHLMIDNIYLNTSKKVLDIVMGPHKLLEHLQAMRRYLLLGQGDFIGLLMENLKPQLDRPAKELYRHDLSSIVDVTVRATNAQFDDPEVLNYLDVRLMEAFDGDTGWDIFTLRYTVRGPLSTMLEPSMCSYNILFKPLWQTKHIEFILSSKIWKDQKCNEKRFRGMRKELNSINYRLYLYTSEMIHFIHQMQYYILFEVVECSWANLIKQIQQANALDDILEAHQDYLKAIKIGIFLDEKTSALSGNLERVYGSIMKLEIWQDNFNEICNKELNARKKFDEISSQTLNKGQYGVTAENVLERDEEIKSFEHTILNCHKKLEKIGNDFEESVKQFLLVLASTNDNKLQLFGIRLDFNEYYKKRDQRLDLPLTFEHMRMSAMYFNNKSINLIKK